MNTLQLRVLVRKDGDWWVARGVDHDIATQARTSEDLQYDFERMLVTQLIVDAQHSRPPLSSVPRAPAEVERAWQEGLTAVLPPVHRANLPTMRLDARFG